MVKIKMRYFAGIRELLNSTEEEYELDDGTPLKGLILKHVSKRHRSISHNLIFRIFETENRSIKLDTEGIPILRRKYTILINGSPSKFISEGLKYELVDGDVIAILPPVGGG